MWDHELIAAFARTEPSNFVWMNEEEAKKPYKRTKTGFMQVPTNKETFEEMQQASVFTGQWLTQHKKVMNKRRLFRIDVYMYEMGKSKPIHAVARMKKPDRVETLWRAIGEAADFIMEENDGIEWDVERCNATVKV